MPRAHAYRSRVNVKKDAGAPLPTSKDLIDGVMEGGVHAHALDRGLSTTDVSGAHSHLYLLPTGDVIETDGDGMHRHPMEQWDPNAVYDGAHAHGVGEGMTEVDGWHHHELQTGTTLIDGTHSHRAVMGDMTLTSLMPHEIFALRAFAASGPLAALDRSHEVRAHFKADESALSLRWGDAVLTCKLAKGWEFKSDDGPLLPSRADMVALSEASTVGVEVAKNDTDYGEEIAKGTLEIGLVTTDQLELFLQLPAPFAGSLTVARADTGWTIEHATQGVPGILRPGAPPPICKCSALPKSLRDDIPEGGQFWKSTDPDSAAMLRDWLIESEYFTKDATVRLHCGELRKVHTQTKYFGHTPEVVPEDFKIPAEVQRAIGRHSVAKYYTLTPET